MGSALTAGTADEKRAPRSNGTGSARETDGEFSDAVSAIVGAFGDPTRRSIYLFVRDSEGVSAAEVATQFELHPNVARHHLDKLVGGGYLDYDTTRQVLSGAGRPSKRYRGSRKSSLFDRERKQFELMSMLLSKTLDLLPMDQAEQMAEEVGEFYGKSIAKDLDYTTTRNDLTVAMRAIADALTAHGFASRQETQRQHLTVINDACPFGTTAVDHPVLCAVDRGIIRGMLSTLYGKKVPVTLTSRARGDVSCSVAI